LLKEQVVLAALERELAADMNSLVLQWHCNAAQITDFGDDKLFEFHMLKAEELFNDIGKHYLPWYPQWSNTEAVRLVRLYKAFLEEEKLPGFQEWRSEVKKALDSKAAEREAEARQFEVMQERRVKLEQELRLRQSRRHARAGLR